ncbi:MAG TPA: hypothetical protein VF590_16115, partial [Isosphaeraceae bacterium]
MQRWGHAVTAARDGREALATLDAGFDDYIAKPLRPATLARAIDRLVPPDRHADAADLEPGPTFDRAAALAGLQGDEDLLRDLATMYLDHYPQMIAELRAALGGGPGDLYRAAHKLKGDIGYFAAPTALVAALRLAAIG